MSKESKDNSSFTSVLDFISGQTETTSAKRLTAGIRSRKALWLLAKMTKDARLTEKGGK